MELIEELLTKEKSIIIYGAGAIANIVFFYLKDKGLEQAVKCFAVSNEESHLKRERHGKEKIVIEEAVNRFSDALVVLAAQVSTQKQMEKRLEELCYDKYCRVNPKRVINAFYSMLHTRPIEPHKIVFMNYQGCGYGCNPKYIAEKLICSQKRDELDLVWVVDENPHSFPDEIRTVLFESFEYYEEMATARIWIDNSRKQMDIKKREGQYYIQTWHGAAPFKKVEKDLEGIVAESLLNIGIHDSEMIDLFLSGSKFYTELINSSFWYSKEIMKVGLPRHDVFWRLSEIRNKVKRNLGVDSDNIMVLLSPTFRDDFAMDAYDFDIVRIKEALEQRFRKNIVMLISKHPNNRNLKYGFEMENCIDVSGYDDFEELLAAAEILITDYSGCMYDFSYKLEPVFLYQKDYERLCMRRGFYVSMEDVPYPRATTNEELIEKILRFHYEEYRSQLKQFMMQFGNYDCGEASGKVADYILKLLDEK